MKKFFKSVELILFTRYLALYLPLSPSLSASLYEAQNSKLLYIPSRDVTTRKLEVDSDLSFYEN